jgi:hypothetical protein
VSVFSNQSRRIWRIAVNKLKRITFVSAISAAMITIMSGAAFASTYVAYEGRGFTGRTQVITACGTSNIHFHGSYKWYGSGQDGFTYNRYNARGKADRKLISNREHKRVEGVPWKSLYIVC